jgi:hypothetical protein
MAPHHPQIALQPYQTPFPPRSPFHMEDATSEMDKLIKEAFKNMWHAEWEGGQEEFQRDDQAQVYEGT